MVVFKKERLEKAIEETYLDVLSGEVENLEIITVKSVLHDKVTTGRIEE